MRPAHFAVLVVLALAVGSAAAQPMSGPPNALQGFSVNRDKPVHITSVTLIGSVVITQGQQVIKGDRLTVDLTTGVSHVEGSVQGLLFPNSRPKTGDKTGDGKAGDSKAADTKATDTKPTDTRAADTRDTRTETSRGREAPKPSAKSQSGQPLKLN